MNLAAVRAALHGLPDEDMPPPMPQVYLPPGRGFNEVVRHRLTAAQQRTRDALEVGLPDLLADIPASVIAEVLPGVLAFLRQTGQITINDMHDIGNAISRRADQEARE